jgi:aldose 1-epimerase
MKAAGLLVGVLLLISAPGLAQYSAARMVVDGLDVIRLDDAGHNTSVSIAPTIGNIAFEMKVNGKNVLHFPYASVAAFREKPRMCGIPLLAPWADRLDEQAFYANGKRYPFNMSLGNVRGGKNPIHGFLTLTSDWKVTALEADSKSARVTSRLEVWRRSDWMAQFPFAHAIEMTYSLEGGVLEVRTRVENHGADPMPLSLGYHSFYQIVDAPRNEWTAGMGASIEWTVDKDLLPTGKTRPLSELVSNPADFPLKGRDFDNGFAGLIRDSSGRASFWVKGKQQKIEVLFGPKFTTGEIYSPANREFICYEPMTALNNGMNLAHRGIYKELQTIPPGGTWQESFWVRPSGY